MSKSLKALALVTTAVMYVVLLLGSLVTTTGSADGCGASWPLCHGELLPAFTFHTLVEFSHRAVSGVAGIMVITLSAWAWRALSTRRVIRLLAPASVLFLGFQAILGALAVLWPQPKTVLALHLGISLVSFASVLLTAVVIFVQNSASCRVSVDPRLRTWIWFSLGYIYVVVYLGALVRHTGTSLACQGWPLCSGKFLPFVNGPEGVNFAHRVAALLALLVIARLFILAHRQRRERPDLYLGGFLAFILTVLQTASGALQALSMLSTPTRILHSAILIVLFGTLSYLCLQSTDSLLATRPSAATL